MCISGLDERGVKPPLVRLPGKTALSAVLLSANPWEQRDLVKRLQQIQKEKTRKARSLEWTQRQFFVNQVFDTDLNLRFSKLLASKSAGPSNIRSSGGLKEESVKLPSIKRHPLRIFASPMPQNRPKCPRRKKRNRTEEVHSARVVKLPQLDTQFNVDENGNKLDDILHESIEEQEEEQRSGSVDSGVEEVIREESQNECNGVVGDDNTRVKLDPLDEPDQATDAKGIGEGDRETYGITNRDALDDNDNDERASRASFASIVDDLSGDEKEFGNPHEKSHSSLSSEESGYDDLCKPAVITRLTRTLPATLMLKANQNINKVIFERKRTMLQKSKAASLRNTFVDPRWESLESSLVTENDSLKIYSEWNWKQTCLQMGAENVYALYWITHGMHRPAYVVMIVAEPG